MNQKTPNSIYNSLKMKLLYVFGFIFILIFGFSNYFGLRIEIKYHSKIADYETIQIEMASIHLKSEEAINKNIDRDSILKIINFNNIKQLLNNQLGKTYWDNFLILNYTKQEQEEINKVLQNFQNLETLIYGFPSVNSISFHNKKLHNIYYQIINDLDNIQFSQNKRLMLYNTILHRVNIIAFFVFLFYLGGFIYFISKQISTRNELLKNLNTNNLALKENQKKLLKAQEIAQLGFYNVNLDTQSVTASAVFKKIVGFEKDEEIQFDLWNTIIHPDDILKIESDIAYCIKTGAKLDHQYRIITKDKKELKWIQGLAEYVFKDGHPTYLNGTVQDITEKHKLERNFMHAFIDAQEQEKISFGEDLHDGIGQILAAESMYIQVLKKLIQSDDPKIATILSKISELNLSAINDARGIAHGLMSKQLQENGLLIAIEHLCKDYNQSKNVRFIFKTEGLIEGEISKEIKLNLFRITQEVSTNTIRHSGASVSEISLYKTNQNQLQLIIKDNGVGIDLERIKRENKGAGLKNIERRVTLLNGKLELDTAPKKGTCYTIVVPL